MPTRPIPPGTESAMPASCRIWGWRAPGAPLARAVRIYWMQPCPESIRLPGVPSRMDMSSSIARLTWLPPPPFRIEVIPSWQRRLFQAPAGSARSVWIRPTSWERIGLVCLAPTRPLSDAISLHSRPAFSRNIHSYTTGNAPSSGLGVRRRGRFNSRRSAGCRGR